MILIIQPTVILAELSINIQRKKVENILETRVTSQMLFVLDMGFGLKNLVRRKHGVAKIE